MVVAACAAFFVTIAHLEPVSGDGWGLTLINSRHPPAPANLLDFAVRSYVGGNPRLGQVFAYLVYGPSPIHEILTPAVLLATFLAAFVAVVGRWPRPSHGRDTLLLAALLSLFWVGVPSSGLMVGYRPFTTNYVYGFCLQLWLFVPYRLYLTAPRSHYHHPLFAAGLLVLGVASGLTNEHTGPTMILAMALVIGWYWRREQRLPMWMLAGLVGLVIGYAMLFFAPGQSIRYGGLANEQSIIQRLASRGIGGNVDILLDFARRIGWVPYVALLVLWTANWRRRGESPMVFGRKRLALSGLLAAMAIMMVATLWASPKLGPRLLMAPALLACIAAAVVVNAGLGLARVRALVALGAILINGYYGARLFGAMAQAHGEYRDRVAVLSAATPGSHPVLRPYTQLRKDKWFFGEDFRSATVQKRASDLFGLSGISLRQPALGLPDVSTEYAYEFLPPLSPVEDGRLRTGLVAAGPRSMEEAKEKVATVLDRIDHVPGHLPKWVALRVHGLVLPDAERLPVVLALWHRDGAREWSVSPARIGKSKERTLAFGSVEPAAGARVFLASPPGPARELVRRGEDPYRYVPWRTGRYAVIVCDTSRCEIVAIFSHRI